MSRRLAPVGLPSRPNQVRRRSSAEGLRAVQPSTRERPLVSQRSMGDLGSTSRREHPRQPMPSLPSNPARGLHPSNPSNSERSISSQRSTSSLKHPPSRQRLPSLPSNPRSGARHLHSRSDAASISSGQSAASSLFDKTSNASSSTRTSLEDTGLNDKPSRTGYSNRPVPDRHQYGFSREQSTRQEDARRLNVQHSFQRSRLDHDEAETFVTPPTEKGYYDHDVVDSYLSAGSPSSPPPDEEKQTAGSAIWSHVAAAASYLTINVSKAWEANIRGHDDGNETPPGAESRLTLAMKAFHIQQARSPQDLPEWLFEPHERQVRSSTKQEIEQAPSRRDVDHQTPDIARERDARPRGLRDVYASATASSQSGGAPPRVHFDRPRVVHSAYAASDGGDALETKATSRLRAARDAKRAALIGKERPATDYDGRNPTNQHSGSVFDEDLSSSPGRPMASARRGLPAGPGPRRSAARF